MSVVNALDVSHVRFRAPDLSRMRQFFEDFGMVTAQADDHRLFMRGHGTAPFVHTAELGPAGFVGFGLKVADADGLERIAVYDNVAISAFDAPGGGQAVFLTDPDGYQVEIICGQSEVGALTVPEPMIWNERDHHRRLNKFRRIASGPSHVLRLGHVVLSVSDFRTSEAWYKERFGLITSDEIQTEPGVAIGAFLRSDQGEIPSDHHTLFLFEHPDGPGFLHAAFEVAGFDDLMAGRDHLLRQGAKSVWGIGRHILGSQIFDYWHDPYGHEVEHWTDGDQLRASDGGGIASLETLTSIQWGMAFPGAGP
jgi:catechol 2,3-dioxygenase-like lactoylglutathione lyase family enzyme